MALKKVGIYNDIPEEFLPKLPEAGTVVTFKAALTIIDTNENTISYQNMIVLPVTSSFRNPKTGEAIKIGLVHEVDNSGNITGRTWHTFEPRKTSGLLVITIGLSEEMDTLYQYLMLASFVGTNENRYKNEPIILNLVDYKKEAASKRENRSVLVKALNAAMDVADEDLTEKCMLLGINSKLTNEEIRNAMEEMASADPAGFLTKINDQDAALIACVNNAMALGVLVKDGVAIKWADGGVALFELTQDDELLIPSEFCQFIKNEKAGAKLVTKIKTICDKIGKNK